MSDKKYSNLHPKELAKLKKALEYGSRIDPLREKEYNKKLKKEVLEKARLDMLKRKKEIYRRDYGKD